MEYCFLIPEEDVKHYDFVWNLVKAVDFQNWYYNEKKYIIKYIKNAKLEKIKENEIPVGSLDFVLANINKKVHPINIPKSLATPYFLKRKIWQDVFLPLDDPKLVQSIEENFENSFFVKTQDKYKDFCDIISLCDLKHLTPQKYFISEKKDIISEWRSFIFNDKLVGLQNYDGDFTCFPDTDFLKKCIDCYTNSPRAYTLDIGIGQKKENFIIEVHPFVSCGLYGFEDYRILPQMIISGFKSL
jgi:hypothetical protein